MGRRPTPLGLQDAKGNPGKRLSKAARQIANADRLAGLIAAAPIDADDPLAPPKFFDDRSAAALAVWREYAPKLQAIHLLDPLFRTPFALFCVYAAEFYQAHEDVLANGHYTRVRTISGDMMPRLNPMLQVRDAAAARILELSKRFGFSPIDQAAIFKDHAAARSAAELGGLFGQAPPQAVDETPAADRTDPIGEIGRFKGALPGLVN